MDPTETPGDALSAALLPVLMHQLNGATQVLTSLSAVLSLPDGDRWLREKANDMSSVSREIEDLGWLLAVLSTASGSNLLLARREERGLEIMTGVVRHALRREGRDLAEHEGPLPHLDPAGGQGWELPWAIGLLLLETGRALPPGQRSPGQRSPGQRGPGQRGPGQRGPGQRDEEGAPTSLRWSLNRHAEGGGTLHLESEELSLSSGLERLAETLGSAISGIQLRAKGPSGLELSVPQGWLR